MCISNNCYIKETEILQYNGAFLEMLGLKHFPDQSTLRRFLKRLPPEVIRRLVRLYDSLRTHLFYLPTGRTTLIFDLDSVVITIYGKQEGGKIGYNPKKHGRRSYHPLLYFESHFQKFWHGSLRPGNAASSTGVIPFIKVCLNKAPKTIARSRIRFRMDPGYYGSQLIRFLDSTGDHPHRFYSNSCKISQKRQTQYRETSSRLSLPERIFTGISENWQTAFTPKISFLQVS